jgi:mannose/fructose/N-acetylgalactosamine-specific phosphotransferase system component IIC
MMTAVGFGILLSQIWSGDIAIFFFVGFVLSKSLGLSSLGVAVIAAAVALLYFVIEKDIVARKGRGDTAALEEGSAGSAPVNAPANTEEDFF